MRTEGKNARSERTRRWMTAGFTQKSLAADVKRGRRKKERIRRDGKGKKGK
jgi:hypothetical protein